MTIRMRHDAQEITCPLLADPTNYHFEMRCEDCDLSRLSVRTLGTVEDLFHQGRITEDEFEAYMHVWAILSPTGSYATWRDVPTLPDVQRMVRKLLIFSGKG